MKIIEHIEKAKNPLFSFEIIPPQRGTSAKEIIDIVEAFLRSRKRICYGGTAINNILPPHDQFYNRAIELPDYDFFSPEPLKDAKELANIYIVITIHQNFWLDYWY